MTIHLWGPGPGGFRVVEGQPEQPAVPELEVGPDGLARYRPDGPVLRAFLRSNALVRIIRGPIRSGTSVACLHEIYRRAAEQKPARDGLRRTRFAVIRDSYPNLEQSTLQTWLAWFPEGKFGRMVRAKPMRFELAVGDIRSEVVFLALDNDEDVQKLRSTEWTGIFINELEFTSKAIFQEARSRVGFYPPQKEGGCTWAGVWADMNAPPEDNWVVQMTGEVPVPEDVPEHLRAEYVWPAGWDYFVQPPAMVERLGADGKTVVGYDVNADAENLKWLKWEQDGVSGLWWPLYWHMTQGATRRWIESRLMNRITAPAFGQPVHPGFRPETHVAAVELLWERSFPLVVSLDFGRRPFALCGQRVASRWHLLREFRRFDESAAIFAPKVKAFLAERFPEAWEAYFVRRDRQAIQFVGDPKGQDKGQADERTAYEVFAAHGMIVRPAPVKSNAIRTRLAIVDAVLGALVDGVAKLLLCPRGVPQTRMALAGGYHFSKDVNDSGDVLPEKDKFSEPADCLQYMLAHGGEGHVMTGRERAADVKPLQVRPHRRSLRRVGRFGRAA